MLQRFKFLDTLIIETSSVILGFKTVYLYKLLCNIQIDLKIYEKPIYFYLKLFMITFSQCNV